MTKRIFQIIFAVSTFSLLAISCSTSSPQPTSSSSPSPAVSLATVPIDPPVTNCNITPPNTPVTTALLSSGLPCAATLVAPFDLNNLQHGFDFYSWLTFLDLNAPASGGVIGKDAPTKWEQWKEVEDIMLDNGQKPPAWEQEAPVPKACQGLAASNPNMKVLRMVGKTHDLLSEFDEPFDTGPLIDQAGQYVRYEILVNRPMFEFIVQNQLYNQQGQASFTNPIVFPAGNVISGSNGNVGAIMVKAAWKVLSQQDDASKFHQAQALVYTPPTENPKVAEKCELKNMGLVGLHVVHKTKNEPQWLWSSFEHVKNVPTAAEVKAKTLQASYNFYNAACANCPVNTPPKRPWDPNAVPFPGGFKSQIVRVTSLTTATNNLNSQFQKILPGAPWENYMLISTQWPTDGQSKTDPLGVPAPNFLANTTMETYVQGTVPQASSSCMACHGNAAATSGRTADFTYILERAKRQVIN
ncbi:MAG: cytochrome C [Blastocatellia bacterium]